MEKKIFNPSDWLQKPVQEATHKAIDKSPSNAEAAEVEAIIKQIEEKSIDIATAYSDWRNIGFAFAHSFGENGRDYFHRISCFYSDYSTSECDKQYTHCLKANGQGVTLKTFFFHCKQAGVKISKEQTSAEQETEKLPSLPDKLFQQLPDFLQRVVEVATSNEERDILLLGSIVSLSACFPKLVGVYDGKQVYPNLYLFITAQASAGKGRLIHCKQLIKPIHKHLREQAKLMKNQYDLDLLDYNENKGKDSSAEKPSKPPEKMLFIPANNSTTGVYQLLSENEGKGIIFETEGDTLAQAFKTDYGNYSEGFRKAFHHETITYYRRTEREYVDIDKPCLSAVLSGTPKQVSNLIPSAENGLFSRFIFYFMNVSSVWKDVFAISSDNGLDDYFDKLGNEFFSLYQTLQSNPEIQFTLTVSQQQQFNVFFQEVQNTYITLKGLDYMATVRRLGLITFRMCMILSALRIMETGELPSRIVCEERDFQTTISMAKVLVKHSAKVFSELPEEVQHPKRLNKKEKFLEALPKEFNRQDYLKIAASLKVPDKTAEGYITEFCSKGLLHREMKDHYINANAKEIQETKDSKDTEASS